MLVQYFAGMFVLRSHIRCVLCVCLFVCVRSLVSMCIEMFVFVWQCYAGAVLYCICSVSRQWSIFILDTWTDDCCISSPNNQPHAYLNHLNQTTLNWNAMKTLGFDFLPIHWNLLFLYKNGWSIFLLVCLANLNIHKHLFGFCLLEIWYWLSQCCFIK